MTAFAPQPTRTPYLRRASLAGAAVVLALAAGLMATRGRTAEEEPGRSAAALPRFEGPLVGGGRGGSDQLLGRRALLIVFSPGAADVPRAAKLVTSLADEAREANIALLGVAVGASAEEAARAGRLHDLDFPLVVDERLDIARKLRFDAGTTQIWIVDAKGLLIGGFRGLDPDTELDALYESELRRVLHLRSMGSLRPGLGIEPPAPAFEVVDLQGRSLSSSTLEGKVRVAMFFLPTCPHCHDMLHFFKKFLAQSPHPDLVFVPISASEQRYVVEQMVDDLGLEFPVYLDPQRTTVRAFEHRAAVPDILVIDRRGRITARHTGADARLQALLTMEIRAALGVENPILLDRTGYSGADFCEVCHRDQHASWSLTPHAFAFETLVEHGADRNPECVGCHTVGWNEPGGYSLERPAPWLEGVQCENCHGRGGPHQSPDFAVKTGFQGACAGCHTEQHSLHFSFAERLPLVSHAANRADAELSVEDRLELIRKRDKRHRTLFQQADYVGSQTCAGCHPAEHQQWAGTAHARAFETLRSQSQHEVAKCQKCHTTGFGEKTGWPAGGQGFAGVGCESCHGPGGRHVAAGAERRGSILRLADKCDSCVILQICGSCHDDANDPGFEFELDSKLAPIRHGAAPGSKP